MNEQLKKACSVVLAGTVALGTVMVLPINVFADGESTTATEETTGAESANETTDSTEVAESGASASETTETSENTESGESTETTGTSETLDASEDAGTSEGAESGSSETSESTETTDATDATGTTDTTDTSDVGGSSEEHGASAATETSERASLEFGEGWTLGEDGVYTRTIYMAQNMLETVSWADLGVTIDSEAEDIEVQGEDVNVSIDGVSPYYGRTGTATIMTESVKGVLTVKGFYNYIEYGNYYVQSGSSMYLSSEEIEELRYRVSDEGVAKLAKMTGSSISSVDGEEYTYTYYMMNGRKSGTAKILLESIDGNAVYGKTEANVTVYELTTNLKLAQALGTEQTFTVAPEAGYEIVGVDVYAYDNGEDEPVKLTKNADGSYTLVISRKPHYEWTNEVTGETREFDSDYVELAVTMQYGDDYVHAAYTVKIAESAGEVVAMEAAKEYGAEIAEAIQAGKMEVEMNEDGTAVIALTDGTELIVHNGEQFIEAVQSGAKVSTELNIIEWTNEELEELLGDEVTKTLYQVMGDGKTGSRMLEIGVSVYLNDYDYYGEATELAKPLTIAVDVSDDLENAVADGYMRKYTVVRYHNGEAEMLDDADVEYDPETGMLYITTDKFSTYMVAYEDVLAATYTASSTSVKTADTGRFTSVDGGAAAEVDAAVVLAGTVVLLVALGVAAKRFNA